MSNQLRQYVMMAVPLLSQPAVTLLGLTTPTIAQPQLTIIETVPGLPDLTATAHNAGYIIINTTPKMSSRVTITVQNRLTAPQMPPYIRTEGPPKFFGSEARGVFVHIAIPAPLSSTNILPPPAGFMCLPTADNHNVYCWGTLGAGKSVDLKVDVVSEDVGIACGLTTVNVQAEVDPQAFIGEVYETNNTAHTGVEVINIC
jgi:hypothetical protein